MDKTLKHYSEEYGLALQHYLAQRQELNLEFLGTSGIYTIFLDSNVLAAVA